MASTVDEQAVRTVFHLQTSPERTLILPDDLLRQLGVEPGDVLALSVHSGHGLLHKAPKAQPAQPVETEPVPEVEGLLADYFTDHEDVLRFIEDERDDSSA